MKKHSFILALVLFLSLNNSVVLADDMLAVVIKSQNMPDFPAGFKLPANTVIETEGNQRLALKTNAGVTVIVGNSSNFRLVKPSFFNHVFGKIYYFIRSRTEGRRIKIRSHVATLGIRGTEFIITNNDESNGQISLAEGLLDIESNDDEPFAIKSEREPTEFERYKLESLKEMQSINDEFENYKKQINLEFTEYKKSFQLTKNTTLSFDGKNVSQEPLSAEQKEELQSFEAFIDQVDTQ